MTINELCKEIISFNDKISIEKIINPIESTNPNNRQKRFIITGGPGAGKTSIINVLIQRGFLCMRETATEIIEAGIRNGSDKPWRDDDYHVKVYHLMMNRLKEANKSSAPIVFFDRGHLDGISYILLQKRKLYKYIVDCVQEINTSHFFEKKVFFIDNLNFVVPGPARTESLEESLQKARCLERNYRALGYEISHISQGTVEERAQMIIDYVREWSSPSKFFDNT